MESFEDQAMNILLKFLDKKAERAMKEIEEKEMLSEENAIPLILRTQFNHIAHLDKELSLFREMVDKRFEKIEQRFEKIEQRFERVFIFLGIGFTVIAALIVIFQFVK